MRPRVTGKTVYLRCSEKCYPGKCHLFLNVTTCCIYVNINVLYYRGIEGCPRKQFFLKKKLEEAKLVYIHEITNRGIMLATQNFIC